MSFSQALSGLDAASNNLNVIGNNIANSQTVGFKSSSALFADVYAGAKIGLGTKVAGVLQDFTSGNLETSGRALDLAISGDGFFKLEYAGQITYSRNGQFSLTPDGYMENSEGARLMTADGVVQVPSAAMQARATGTDEDGNPSGGMQAVFNLDATSPSIDPALTFDPLNPTTYSYQNTSTVYDSLGIARQLNVYFVKTADNTWDVHAAIGTDVQSPGSVSFDNNGVLTDTTPLALTFTGQDGAADLAFQLDLAGTTQFADPFDLSKLSQNGYTAGSLVGISISQDGTVVGNYSNEQKRDLATIGLVSFRSPEGLQAIGGNMWVESAASGQPLPGIAGTGRFGSIQSGVLESSNVDLTKELVNLIIAQRNFQANAQSVKTQSDALEQAMNLR